jgi:prepilin-type processing-associated H-X9-DG protein
MFLGIDRTKAWDAEENLVPTTRYYSGPQDEEVTVGPIGEFLLWRCPSHHASAAPGTPGLTHYVGVAGVGPDAARWPLGSPGTGVFGYDRKVTLADIKDGTATTLLTLETTRDNGPWTAGARPTARGLHPAAGPYLGRGGQFAANHAATNAAFADGSVRRLTDSVSPAVLEAVATAAGGELAEFERP